MTTMHLGTLSPREDDNKIIDLKQATFQVTPVDTVTPSLTPTSPPEGDGMAGKKLYSLEKPDDKAKELASKLTLEEQVCTYTGRMVDLLPLRPFMRSNFLLRTPYTNQGSWLADFRRRSCNNLGSIAWWSTICSYYKR